MPSSHASCPVGTTGQRTAILPMCIRVLTDCFTVQIAILGASPFQHTCASSCNFCSPYATPTGVVKPQCTPT